MERMEMYPGLRATTEHSGSAVVVHVGGDVDASNHGDWRQLVSQNAAGTVAPGPFVLDVRGVDFLGSGSYAVMAQTAERCQGRGVSMRLVSGAPVVKRTIAACGLGSLLPMFPTVEAALSSPVGNRG